LRTLIGEENIELSCSASECLHYSEIPDYVTPSPPSLFSPLFVGLTIGGALGLVAAVFGGIVWASRKQENNQNDIFDVTSYLNDGLTEAERNDARRAALMADHIPVTLMFKDISYSVDLKKSKKNKFRRQPQRNDDSSRPLLPESNYPDEESVVGLSQSMVDHENNRLRVLDGVQGYLEPGKVMAIMGGSGKRYIYIYIVYICFGGKRGNRSFNVISYYVIILPINLFISSNSLYRI